MKRACLALLLVFAAPGFGLAQETADPKAWANQFMGLMIQKGPESAYRFLKDNSYIGQRSPRAIAGIRASMHGAFASHGAAIGFEIAGERQVGGSLLLLTYVVKHEASPVIWELDFYRPRSRWNLYKFRFYDNPAKVPHL